MTGLEENLVKESKTKLATEDTSFRQKMSDISNSSRSPIEVRRAIYRLQSELVFCIDSWNKYLADMKRKPKSKASAYASSELLSSTPEDSSAPMSPKIPDTLQPMCKSHRRVRSDGYLSISLSRSLSQRGNLTLHQSVDNLLDTKNTEDCRCVQSEDGGVLEKPCELEEKVDDLKHSESRFSKMASGTKKLFKALTDSYKKIEVN